MLRFFFYRLMLGVYSYISDTLKENYPDISDTLKRGAHKIKKGAHKEILRNTEILHIIGVAKRGIYASKC